MSSLRETVLLGMGNPLLDISAIVGDDILAKYGLDANNAILAEDKHQPLYKELIDNYEVSYLAGGSVQNSLRVAQWIIRKPNVAVFFGCVGKDDYSKTLESKAREAGVNVQYQYNDNVPTGRCGVLITGTHRSLVADLAAANHFTINHIRVDENKNYISKAEYFYISGFFLTVNVPSILEVADHAARENKRLLMNLSAPFISQLFLEPLMKVLPYVDVLFGNELEAESFAKALKWDTTDMKEIGLKIAALPKINSKHSRIVVLTQGHLPVLLIQDEKITEFPVKKLEKEDIVDTNGAGDAFVGGFLAQFVQQKTLDICIRCGIYAARHVIGHNGCSFQGDPEFSE